jgi:uncharacterized membrane protein (UPF0127 family)
MKVLKISIGDKEYEVKVASSDKERIDGLQYISDLPQNEGMLFDFDEPQHVDFWMKDTLIPLDIIFINEELEVIKVKEAQPNDETLIPCDDVSYVLEVNPDSGIKKGDDLDFSSEKMRVLDKDGKSQMELDGGERIFSRKNTVTLIRMAKRAKISNKDGDFKRLGKKIFSYIETQNNNKAEYVEKKD